MPAIGAIANRVGEVERRHPGADLWAAWTADDFASVLGTSRRFCEERGLPRFVAIVKGRKP